MKRTMQITVFANMITKLLLALVAAVGTTQGECPFGWTQLQDHCYRLDKNPASWTDAEAHCQIHGGHLATPKTFEKNTWMKALLTQSFYDKSVWVGGYDDIEEGTWRWPGSETLFTYTDWAPHEPGNSKTDEDCIIMYNKYGFQWADAPCNRAYAFLCETNPRPCTALVG